MLRKIKTIFASKAKYCFLCIISAILLILSFPRSNLWIFAWFGFAPLFFVLENKSKFKVFLFFYLTGIIFWFGLIYWLIHVTLAGTIILVLYLALYFGIFGLLISRYTLYAIRYTLLFIPSAWVILEYIRSHLFTGFGWALLGYSQYLNLSFIQIADIAGVWGVSFLIMMVNVFIYRVLRIAYCVWRKKERQSLSVVYCFIFICLLSLAWGYGFYKLAKLTNSQPPTPSSELQTPNRLSVIQGNIPQELKWQEYSQEFILDRYIKLSKEASFNKPDLIIWPEAASPGFLLKNEDNWIFQNIFNLAEDLKTNMLIGTVVKENSNHFNSALLIDSRGKIIKRYDKLHLVPFGEYIPLKKILGFLQTVVPIGDFISGKEYTLFQIQNPKSKIQNNFAVLICFEDLFPELSRRFVEKGAHFLVNITNDAWYKQTSAAYQHLQASVFRAVENRVFLVRSANTGISGFIRPDGEIVSLVKDKYGRHIFISGHETQEVTIPSKGKSFYTRHGDIFVLICLILTIYGIIADMRHSLSFSRFFRRYD